MSSQFADAAHDTSSNKSTCLDVSPVGLTPCQSNCYIDRMAYPKKVGVFVKVPLPGQVKTRLVPALGEAESAELYRAFLADLFTRLSKLKKISGTIFYAGTDTRLIEPLCPPRFEMVPQEGDSLGERMHNAFRRLLHDDGDRAVIIGSDSPDVPLPLLKRAFLKLKHRDVVLGPAFDGGYYLIGLRRAIASLFEDISWGTDTVFSDTLARIERDGLDLSVLPPWYDVDSPSSLSLLKSMMRARKLVGGDRLYHTEQVLHRLDRHNP